MKCMKAFIREWLPRKAGRIAGLPIPLDPAAASARLGVEKLARVAGANNQPPTDMTGLDANEEGFMRHFQQSRGRVATWFEQARAPLEQALWRHRQQLDERRFAECVDEYQRGMTAVQSGLESRLIAANRDVNRALRSLRAFLDANRLQREPTIMGNAILHVGTLLVLVLFEAAVNAWVLAKAVPGGWVEGLVLALFVAGLNVAAAYVGGIAMREVLHIAPLRKALGIAASAAYALLATAFLLLIGNLRLALLANVAQPERAAVQWLTHGQLPPYDVWTVVFIAISAGFAAVAVWSGIHVAGDPYPGYAHAVRTHRGREAELEVLQDHCRAHVFDLYQTQMQAIEQHRAAAHQARSGFRETVTELRRLADQYHGCAAEVDAACQYALRLYRRTNEKVRSASTPRGWSVDEPIQLGTLGIPEGAACTLREATQFAATLDTLIRELDDKATAAQAQLGQAYDATAGTLRAFFAACAGAGERNAHQDTGAAPAIITIDEPTAAAPASVSRPARGNGKDHHAPPQRRSDATAS